MNLQQYRPPPRSPVVFRPTIHSISHLVLPQYHRYHSLLNLHSDHLRAPRTRMMNGMQARRKMTKMIVTRKGQPLLVGLGKASQKLYSVASCPLVPNLPRPTYLPLHPAPHPPHPGRLKRRSSSSPAHLPIGECYWVRSNRVDDFERLRRMIVVHPLWRARSSGVILPQLEMVRRLIWSRSAGP